METAAYEAALDTSEQRRLLAVEAAGIGDWTYDVARGTLVCSPLARAMHGAAPGERITIARHDALIHADDREMVQRERESAMDPAGDGRYHVEFRFIMPNGEIRWIQSVGQAIFADTPGGRRATHVLGAMLDVTDKERARSDAEAARATAEAARVTAEAERRHAERAGRDAELANRAKSGFLATMSHELRTPLNAMLGYTQLLELGLAGPLTDRQREFLDRLSASSQHLLGLVNDILDLSKIEAGEARILRVDAWTGPPISAALDFVRLQASAKGITLVDARPDEIGIPFVGDESRVRQIVLNLLSNAVKFTPERGTVTISCDTIVESPDRAGFGVLPNGHVLGAGPWATIYVADTGVGIAPEEQGRIFDPFHQVDSGHTRTAGGSGLGLAISRRLARLMGGDLTVSSVPGEGSTFSLWLPAARVDGGTQVETAAERGARAEREVAQLHAPGVGAVGTVLRNSLDDVVTAYVQRLRNDPLVPRAQELQQIQLEDHQASFLADIAQSLVIVEEAGRGAEAELRDSSSIQRAIAEAHGARRFAQGFDELAIQRDLQLFREEVERVVRVRLAPGTDDADPAATPPPDLETAVRVLLGLLARAEALSYRAWQRAASGA